MHRKKLAEECGQYSQLHLQQLAMGCNMIQSWHKYVRNTDLMGAFNDDPETIETVQEMIEEEAWTKLGSNTDWWGTPKKVMTCKIRAIVEQSRIDGLLLNKGGYASCA